jgi:preprotein translocase subunit YajC
MYEKIQNLLKRLAESTKATMLMYGIGVLLVAVIIFQFGMIIGARKSSLLEEQKERYVDLTKPLPTAHGTAGRIVAINESTILVADEDNTEKVVVVRDETIIRSLRDDVDSTALRPGDFIVVIGTPNSRGYIQANLIRVLPRD